MNKTNFSDVYEFWWLGLIGPIIFILQILGMYLSPPFTVGVSGLFFVGILAICFIVSAIKLLKYYKYKKMTDADILCNELPVFMNLAIGDKQIAKRIMLYEHKNKAKIIEANFDDWVIHHVRKTVGG